MTASRRETAFPLMQDAMVAPMCLILLACKTHADFPLIVAANRDEFYARPAAVAGFWPDAPQVLAGRDLQAGGAWLGVARSGRFAALTNFRDPAAHKLNAQSRGELVAGFLRGSMAPADYVRQLAVSGADYNGFNLLVGDARALWCYSNQSGVAHELEPGIHGLSNDLLDTPWPKLKDGTLAWQDAVKQPLQEAALLAPLRRSTVYADHLLPQTGVSLEWERALSAAFIQTPDYGTRCTTLLRVGKDGAVIFDEQTWLPGGAPGTRVRHRFQSRFAAE